MALERIAVTPDGYKETARDRQIVGFSLSPATAAAVKMEAARRKLTLRKLFEEMWADYTAKQKPK